MFFIFRRNRFTVNENQLFKWQTHNSSVNPTVKFYAMKAKKTLLAALLALTSASALRAQVVQIGNLGASMTPDGTLFRTSAGQSLLQVPYGFGWSTLFESHLWVYYPQGGAGHGIMPLLTSTLGGPQKTFGPQFAPGAYTTPAAMQKYNRTWRVSQDSVDKHRAFWNTTSYTPAPEVAQFVGSGNPSLGEFPQLQPYANRAADNTYNWAQGDYPVLRGKRSVFALYSDRGVAKPDNNAPTALNIGVEMFEHPLASVRPAFGQTVFVSFTVTNTGTTPIDSLHVGLVADFDIGQADNDYLGTDTAGNFVYGMNYFENEPANGYGTAVPAMGVLALSHPLNRSLRYNPGMTSFSSLAMPVDFQQRVWMMQGRPNNLTVPQYYAPGDPLSKIGSLDDTLMINRLDRALVLTLPVQNLAAGATACFDFAYVVGVGTNRFNSLEVLREYCGEISNEYQTGAATCALETLLSTDEWSGLLAPKVHPNPSSGRVTWTWSNAPRADVTFRVHDLVGRPIWSETVQPNGTALEVDWSHLEPGSYWVGVREEGGHEHVQRVVLVR